MARMEKKIFIESIRQSWVSNMEMHYVNSLHELFYVFVELQMSWAALIIIIITVVFL